MMRKAFALLAAVALATASFVPTDAEARNRHGGYYDGGRHHHYRDRDDDGDALAAGAVGLVLGLALGSMVGQDRDEGCYRSCAPAPRDRYYEREYYEDDRYYEDQRYYDDRGGYEQCWVTEQRYDRYERRTVTVRVPC